MSTEFHARLLHAFNKIHYSIPAEACQGRFLDIGCGVGNGVIAALKNGFTTAVGIDRDFGEFPWFSISNFDALCRDYGVDPAGALMVEGDLFTTRFVPQSFDCVLMLDSIEHVPDPYNFVKEAAQYVATGGYLIIDTCPLYCGPEGHHLFEQFPVDEYPWAHLRRDFWGLAKSRGVTEWSAQRFAELNRVTHDQVRDFVEMQGLVVVTEHRDQRTEELATVLNAHRAHLDIEGIDERLLFESWLLIVAQKQA